MRKSENSYVKLFAFFRPSVLTSRPILFPHARNSLCRLRLTSKQINVPICPFDAAHVKGRFWRFLGLSLRTAI